MQVNATVKSPFYHGNKPYAEGDSAKFTKAEANDLEKSGLIEIGGDAEEETEAKMEPAVDNKMADAPANKSRAKKD